jgi:hypothetical protein
MEKGYDFTVSDLEKVERLSVTKETHAQPSTGAARERPQTIPSHPFAILDPWLISQRGSRNLLSGFGSLEIQPRNMTDLKSPAWNQRDPQTTSTSRPAM